MSKNQGFSVTYKQWTEAQEVIAAIKQKLAEAEEGNKMRESVLVEKINDQIEHLQDLQAQVLQLEAENKKLQADLVTRLKPIRDKAYQEGVMFVLDTIDAALKELEGPKPVMVDSWGDGPVCGICLEPHYTSDCSGPKPEPKDAKP